MFTLADQRQSADPGETVDTRPGHHGQCQRPTHLDIADTALVRQSTSRNRQSYVRNYVKYAKMGSVVYRMLKTNNLERFMGSSVHSWTDIAWQQSDLYSTLG